MSRHAHAVNKATHAIGKQKILLTACRKDSNNMMCLMKIRVYQAETCSVFMKNVLRIRHEHVTDSARACRTFIKTHRTSIIYRATNSQSSGYVCPTSAPYIHISLNRTAPRRHIKGT